MNSMRWWSWSKFNSWCRTCWSNHINVIILMMTPILTNLTRWNLKMSECFNLSDLRQPPTKKTS
jgi:hypothetical protein